MQPGEDRWGSEGTVGGRSAEGSPAPLPPGKIVTAVDRKGGETHSFVSWSCLKLICGTDGSSIGGCMRRHEQGESTSRVVFKGISTVPSGHINVYSTT
ncbi:hypothetical protein GWI33_006268 [Rhynchophorus ferrugineus]|uniref:Uncharacterized protein n=1 Tax=Rhynchophorus ferrugineus TaxID=354439 RepID=A0A834ILT0_RHYFE|nr:hypothetical protein GWI33_006268 [Rhynchophorus ferrugineus]